MRKTSRQNHNFADVLAAELQFAVLTKPGRIQILVKPKAKQLRKRGKRGWQLFGTVEDQPDPVSILDEILKRAILEVESADSAANGKGKKLKAAPAAAE
jgi:hypothetical protein